MMTTNTNQIIVIHRLLNLQNALADCGIESDLSRTEDGSLMLTSQLWNCFDGSDVEFTVYADAAEDFEEISHYADTHEHDADILAELEAAIEEN